MNTKGTTGLSFGINRMLKMKEREGWKNTEKCD
jgi:hypothetical protein